MDNRRVIVLLVAIIIGFLLVSPAYAFVGTGVSLNNKIGDRIDFNLGSNINAANAGFGLAGLNIGVDWGVDYDINTLAGYPYGYGGIGAITAADLGYNVGITMDEAHAVGYDGSPFGVPFTEGALQRTHLDQSVANRNRIMDTQVALPFFGFPVLG